MKKLEIFTDSTGYQDTFYRREYVIMSSMKYIGSIGPHDDVFTVASKHNPVGERVCHIGYVLDNTYIDKFSMQHSMRAYGLRHPKTYGAVLPSDFPEGEFVYKPTTSSMSMGNFVGTRSMFHDIREGIISGSISDEELMSSLNIADIDDLKSAKNAIKGVFYIAQEKIDIKREFRVLVFITGDGKYETICEERNGYDEYLKDPSIDPMTYKRGRVHNVIELEMERELATFIDNTIVPFMENLSKKYHSLGFDIYLDKDGNYGVFEFQPGFGIGYDAEVASRIKTLNTKSLIYRCKRVVESEGGSPTLRRKLQLLLNDVNIG